MAAAAMCKGRAGRFGYDHHPTTRPLTNADRQRRYRARQDAEYRQAVAERRTPLYLSCRRLVAHDITLKRCRFVEEYIAPRLRYRDIRNAALAYRLAAYAPRWSAVLGPKLRATDCVTWAIRWATVRIRDRLAAGSVT